ncbi:major capsid protein [Betapolyomavirus vicugnae]|uniref:Major capsid protein VP1 n=1 Tax=Alpaca polyomavirus TaxID=1970065 RepID=A0A1V0CLV8_9POLY|nr:major capsid protein [Betapolyomavirus vicugnae]ARA71318.1 major capsid protein [Betapolyomavirus vicugnae]
MATKGKKGVQVQRPVQKLPRQVKKGGVEILATVPLNEHTEYHVEMFLQPTFGNSNGEGNFFSIGSPMTKGNNPDANTLLCYSLGLVVPPEIPNQVDENSMIVWELYRLETEVLMGAKTHSTGYVGATKNIGGVEGPQFYFWAVGGQPLEVLGIKPRADVTYPQGIKGPPNGTQDYITNSTPRAIVDKPQYPIETWLPDPSRNDNCKYFGRVIGGNQTPPVLTFSNSNTVPVLDEYGVGILLLQGRLYVTSGDMVGLVGEDGEETLGSSTSNRRVHAAPGRFFRFHFRQRKVRNPYTINLLYKQVFNKPDAEVVAQVGVTEVTITQENQPLPTVLQGSVGGGFNSVTNALKQTTGVLQTTTPLVNTQAM